MFFEMPPASLEIGQKVEEVSTAYRNHIEELYHISEESRTERQQPDETDFAEDLKQVRQIAGDFRKNLEMCYSELMAEIERGEVNTEKQLGEAVLLQMLYSYVFARPDLLERLIVNDPDVEDFSASRLFPEDCRDFHRTLRLLFKMLSILEIDEEPLSKKELRDGIIALHLFSLYTEERDVIDYLTHTGGGVAKLAKIEKRASRALPTMIRFFCDILIAD